MHVVVNCGCREKHPKQHSHLNTGRGLNQWGMKMFLSTVNHVTHAHRRECPTSGRIDDKANYLFKSYLLIDYHFKIA